MESNAVEIRPETEVAADIKKAVKTLNLLIREAKHDKGLTVKLSLPSTSIESYPIVQVEITKTF